MSSTRPPSPSVAAGSAGWVGEGAVAAPPSGCVWVVGVVLSPAAGLRAGSASPGVPCPAPRRRVGRAGVGRGGAGGRAGDRQRPERVGGAGRAAALQRVAQVVDALLDLVEQGQRLDGPLALGAGRAGRSCRRLPGAGRSTNASTASRAAASRALRPPSWSAAGRPARVSASMSSSTRLNPVGRRRARRPRRAGCGRSRGTAGPGSRRSRPARAGPARWTA